jgi:hypothetical protein
MQKARQEYKNNCIKNEQFTCMLSIEVFQCPFTGHFWTFWTGHFALVSILYIRKWIGYSSRAYLIWPVGPPLKVKASEGIRLPAGGIPLCLFWEM